MFSFKLVTFGNLSIIITSFIFTCNRFHISKWICRIRCMLYQFYFIIVTFFLPLNILYEARSRASTCMSTVKINSRAEIEHPCHVPLVFLHVFEMKSLFFPLRIVVLYPYPFNRIRIWFKI